MITADRPITESKELVAELTGLRTAKSEPKASCRNCRQCRTCRSCRTCRTCRTCRSCRSCRSCCG